MATADVEDFIGQNRQLSDFVETFRGVSESDKHWKSRREFIFRNISDYEEKTRVDHMLALSMVWANHVFLGCRYSPELLEKVQEMAEGIVVEDAPVFKTRDELIKQQQRNMEDTKPCGICADPIDPLDNHLHCVACLGLAHAVDALLECSCAHCANLPVRVLRSRRDMARSLMGMRPTAASELLVGPLPPSRDGGDDTAWNQHPLTSPLSPFHFMDEGFCPPPAVADFVSFAADREPERPGTESPLDLQEELVRVLEKAVKELDLDWSTPEEPTRSKLDSWYLQSDRRQAALRKNCPFFPEVHEHVVKSWSAPQSARVHTSSQSIFSHVDGAEAHGYIRVPPVEKTVAAHLCDSSSMLSEGLSLPSKPSRFTAHLSDKAYASAGEAASALHSMAVLQVFQAKLLQSLDSSSVDADAVRDLRAATDFSLMAIKRCAQAIGRSMGSMVVLQRHLWLTLTELKDSDRRTLLNAPITPASLFGDAVESVVERLAGQQSADVALTTSRPEPDVHHKQWWGSSKRRYRPRRNPQHNSRLSSATKPSS